MAQQSSWQNQQAQVDINTATRDELARIRGIGETRAQRIVEFREKNGPFKSLDDINKIPGFGEQLTQDTKSALMVGRGGAGRSSR